MKVVVLSGAGISAESGLKTFRDSDGLWEGHRVEDVATPQAWRRDPAKVLQFYNERRKALLAASPNAAHAALSNLQQRFHTFIVTQNVDDLHERAGSKQVLHLHGELRLARSTKNPSLIYPIDGWELKLGDVCELGSQLRPHIVWFGEMVPEIENAQKTVSRADILLVVGTSLQVYPAAGLVEFAPRTAKIIVVNPVRHELPGQMNFNREVIFIEKKAVEGVAQAIAML